MKKITKVVIPAAGFGTRFLPQTKAMPKEMLPIVDKPVIQYVVEEAIDSGITNIIIITGSNKRAIEDHFDVSSEDLVKNLTQGKKLHLLKEIERISEMANFIYIRQKGPYGNGTPVLTAEPAIENEPFAVLWGDEFIYSKPPRLAQMIKVYEKLGGVIISGVKIEKKEDLKRYGIADLTHVDKNVYRINKIVEKPEFNEAPSNIATHGGYILPPEIFSALKRIKPGRGGEIWLTDAINLLKKEGIPVYTVVIENGKYYDTGNKFEYLKTVIAFALTHKEINGDFRTFLKSLKI
ncbi:UTP--glucose-1-phosphate uridylyltransferase [Candidatus Roizmanbacteria bacterium CG_4_10_14_0_2_um_filter_36_35]|uniref:UTP--glucose-1-phosphate uridylyltransferase n=4 Tax=Candidatus Roizmaniibacteriota TaxID=1752723 RepID=A0A2M7BW99_9BACT|nr:MAG: UTP--glucose-1-phosphate uridylyltransferase [Candidatus Roizmanbacteria bacterium CG11_big_fil_rev_8_21_14_0_20_35_14]PIV10820.1 MAG: UTP--glucose-1-phosphate uridylyltransferase [Candidatus Roizmanbacteria bacterium CG03_land_8_20_14_0_80_35_26]PIZ67963.1 MAG: UTP--glucose-1-phosphate uridylyltransferase [Candidatus Roizmanbacteria bacterium CG_4_10_14_0_2_um_filter_36_35]PJC32653.1 MAG: UTP--glucose-1-phosphate uridylyltransferase [Candidatus Roizmanbacteria bacterium CG_4_9_14_0_2_um